MLLVVSASNTHKASIFVVLAININHAHTCIYVLIEYDCKV